MLYLREEAMEVLRCEETGQSHGKGQGQAGACCLSHLRSHTLSFCWTSANLKLLIVLNA